VASSKCEDVTGTSKASVFLAWLIELLPTIPEMLVESMLFDPLARLRGVEIGAVKEGSVVLDKVPDNDEEVGVRLLELKGVDVPDRATRLTAPAIALLVVDEVLVDSVPAVEEVTIVEDVTTIELDLEPDTRSVSAVLEIRLLDVEDDRTLDPDTDEIETTAEAADKEVEATVESDEDEVAIEDEVRPKIKRRSG